MSITHIVHELIYNTNHIWQVRSSVGHRLISTSLWYLSLFVGICLRQMDKPWFISMRVSIGSQMELPFSTKRSNVYFRYKRKSPCLDQDTSIPKKYFIVPKILHFKFLSQIAPKLLCFYKVTTYNNHVINMNNKQSNVITISLIQQCDLPFLV